MRFGITFINPTDLYQKSHIETTFAVQQYFKQILSVCDVLDKYNLSFKSSDKVRNLESLKKFDDILN